MEDVMIRNAVILVALALAVPAAAQAPAPDTENGRFAFSQVPDGFLRLDTRSGHVSICSRREAGWTCLAVPDERAVLEGEIARLQTDNGLLKREMIARGVPLPQPVRPDAPKANSPPPRPSVELRLPSDAELDRVLGFMEKAWRRLLDMVDDMQSRDKKG
jgi:hypothetical protein